MIERIEVLREALHKALDNGDSNEILQASVELDEEIVSAMNRLYVPNKKRCKRI